MNPLLRTSILLLALCAALPTTASAQEVSDADTLHIPEIIRNATPAPLPEEFTTRPCGTGSACWQDRITRLHNTPQPIDLTWRRPNRPVHGVETLRTGRNVIAIEDTDNFIFETGFSGQGSEAVLNRIAQQVYSLYPDEFDFIHIVTSWFNQGAFAYYLPLANDVRGIGWQNTQPFEEIYDRTEGNLEGFIFMNNWNLYMGDQASLGRFVWLQEIGHRWGSFVRYDKDDGQGSQDGLLGRDLAHWSYFMSSHNSALEGNDWNDNGDGSFTAVTSSARMTYSSLDLYSMGTLPTSEVEPWFLIRDPETGGQRDQNGARINPASPPEFSGDIRTIRGTREDITVEDVIRAEGPRVPNWRNAKKTWRVATVLVVRGGEELSDEDFERVDTLIDTWRGFFEDATRGEMDLITNLSGVEIVVDRPFGDECENAAQCDPAFSTTCLPLEDNTSVCSKRCREDSECGAGFCCAGPDALNLFCYPSDESVCEEDPGGNTSGGTSGGSTGGGDTSNGTSGDTSTSTSSPEAAPVVTPAKAKDDGCSTLSTSSPTTPLPLFSLLIGALCALLHRRRQHNV